jgi:putative endopeptidase
MQKSVRTRSPGRCLTALLALITLAVTITPSAARNVATDDMDISIKPGDDFYRYANGGWLKTNTIPAGQSSYDTRAMLAESTSQRVRDLVQNASSAHAIKGSIAQKIGDYYASFLDQNSIDAKGLLPLADEMTRIAAINDTKSLSAYLGTTLNTEVDGLTANADHVFGIWINQGFEDFDHNLPHLWQGGLGLPERDSYLDSSPKMVDLRNQYKAHIGAVLKLAGVADPEVKAARVLSLEIGIAQAFAPDSDAADVTKQNNPWKRTEFSARAPGLDWEAYFQSAGLAQQRDFIVWQPSAVVGVSALVQAERVDAWKDYLRFHLLEHYANVLPRAVAAEHFGFYGTILSGAKLMPDRSTEALWVRLSVNSMYNTIFHRKPKQELRRWPRI